MQSQVGTWAICLLVHPPWCFSEYLLSAKDKTGQVFCVWPIPITPWLLQMRKQRLRARSETWVSIFHSADHVINKVTCPLAFESSPTVVGVATLLSSPIASHLITARAPGPDCLAVMAATPGCTILPEVDEVHQWVGALDAHKAGRMPLLVVACPVWVDHRGVGGGHSLAELTDLERWGRTQKYKVVRRALWHGFQFWLQSLYCLGDLEQVTILLCSSVFSSAKWDNNIAYLVGHCED